MNNQLLRGMFYGIVFSLPLWIIIVIILFMVFGEL